MIYTRRSKRQKYEELSTMPNNRQKKSRADLLSTPDVLLLTPARMEFTFHDARLKRSASYDLLHGGKPVRDDHSLLPYAHGNHACSRDGDCVAEMFFSLSYLILFVIIRQFGVQNYIIISNCASFRQKKIRNKKIIRTFVVRKQDINIIK